MSDKVPMTPGGAQKLKDELARLKEERPKISREIGIAREHGDLSENAEYHAAKERQGLVEARIKDIEDKLSRAEVIDPTKLSGDRVRFGATVLLTNLDTDEEAKYQIVGADEADRIWTHQIQLTIADMVAEAHDTHHPVGVGLYYEDQRPEARRRAADFCENRIPKFLAWFERVLARNPAGPAYVVGGAVSYADTSLFQLVQGLRYAFPKAAARALAQTPQVAAHAERIGALPRIAAYRASERCLPFNEEGIFRHYPELDLG